MLLLASPFVPTAHAQGVADPIPTPIAPAGLRIILEPVATGLSAPNLITHAGDGSGRRFIVEQRGQVLIANDTGVSSTPFLDMGNLLVSPRPNFDERGLLGLAFHPGFADPTSSGFGKLYTYSSEPTSDFTVPLPAGERFDHQSVVSEWRVSSSDPNRVDTSSRRILMRIDEPQFNHNAGMLEFGPDEKLYIALGDGGGSGDDEPGHGVTGNGQNPGNVLGSLLRIDVDGDNSANGMYGVPDDNPFVGVPDAVDEVYAYGLRNPFRFSFDRQSGELVVADVGQGNIEEVNVVTAGGNYGWRHKEGSFAFDPNGNLISDDLTGVPDGLIDPVLEYDHDEGISIIGGYVYRGSEIPELEGLYVFGDFSQGFGTPSGRIFVGDLDTGLIEELLIGPDGESLGMFIKGFGQDEDGELYLLASSLLAPEGDTGIAYRLSAVVAPVPVPAPLAMLSFAMLGLLAASRRSGRGRHRTLPQRSTTASDHDVEERCQ
ncbi:MAG: PQQ-dependent sugar dehydrogenase [Gammaproteobacteria bacterium]|nr:PQQ-dependent sugar dehydrogenase [Gammaproteobacteria bacterium]